ncbi:MAG TPA: acyl transferase, partial [Chitinophagaceae bacterium]|nr:acyl transferase [Chitinophagaceae bacterium]
MQPDDFESKALEVFRFQYSNNPVYRDYVSALHINDAEVRSITQIPFLPISFFKTHSIRTGSFGPEIVFESSGTTTSVNSRHLIKDAELYRKSFVAGFELAYGPVKDWCIIGLLPSYLERGNSSLVYMVNELIQLSGHAQSGFYLDEFDKLFSTLQQLEQAKQKTLLVGVTFALLDFAEKYNLPLKHTIIMETGGMKGRREEMVREEVHVILKKSFG